MPIAHVGAGESPHALRPSIHQQFSVNIRIGVVAVKLTGQYQLPSHLNDKRTVKVYKMHCEFSWKNLKWSAASGSCVMMTLQLIKLFWMWNLLHSDERRDPAYCLTRSPDFNPCAFCIWSTWRPRSMLKPSAQGKNLGSGLKKRVRYFEQSMDFLSAFGSPQYVGSIVRRNGRRPFSTFTLKYLGFWHKRH
jgi:hypothetical protein